MQKKKGIMKILILKLMISSKQIPTVLESMIVIRNTAVVLKSKEKEKAKITKRLGDLSVDERRIEDTMKNHRLGKWGVGFEMENCTEYPKKRELKDLIGNTLIYV